MSVTMAYGMEVYNVAWKMGIPTMPGGFSNMTNDVFLGALVEASYMWLFVLLFSNLWGTRGGAALALLWNLFAAGPVSRFVFARCFSHVGEPAAATGAVQEERD